MLIFWNKFHRCLILRGFYNVGLALSSMCSVALVIERIVALKYSITYEYCGQFFGVLLVFLQVVTNFFFCKCTYEFRVSFPNYQVHCHKFLFADFSSHMLLIQHVLPRSFHTWGPEAILLSDNCFVNWIRVVCHCSVVCSYDWPNCLKNSFWTFIEEEQG